MKGSHLNINWFIIFVKEKELQRYTHYLTDAKKSGIIRNEFMQNNTAIILD